MTFKVNGNLKWVAWGMGLLIAGLLGFADLKGDVREVTTRVEVQYQAILRELNDIKDRLP